MKRCLVLLILLACPLPLWATEIFGYNTAGSNSFNNYGGILLCTRSYVVPGGGSQTVQSLEQYVSRTSLTTKHIRIGLYSAAGTLLVQSQELLVTSATPTWLGTTNPANLNPPSYVATGGSAVKFCTLFEDNDTNWYNDLSGQNVTYIASTYSNGLPSTLPGGMTTSGGVYDISIRAVVDPGGICTGSGLNLNAPTWNDVATCHAIATSGATITVAAGSYTAYGKLTITKWVKIIAGGTVNVTDNTCSGVCTDNFMDIVESANGSTRLSGFTFIQGTAEHYGFSNALISISHLTAPVDTGYPILIDHNSYTIGSNKNGDFIWANTNRGVIYDNTYTGNPHGSSCGTTNQAFMRQVMGTGSPGWQSPTLIGLTYAGAAGDVDGDENIYLEHNTLSFNSLIDISAYGRTVLRFNTIVAAGGGTHGITFHNGRLMQVEYNTFTWNNMLQPDCDGGTAPMTLRAFMRYASGTGMFHHNYVDDINSPGFSGDASELFIEYEQIGANKGGWPCWASLTPANNGFPGYPGPENPGWGYTVGGTNNGFGTGEEQDLEPIYVFGNTGPGNYPAPSIASYPNSDPESCVSSGVPPAEVPSATQYIQEDRDYYLDKTATFDGTSGVGSGTRAARPASTTNGVAYWSTDQGGDWDRTSANANDGCLDKVVSGAWVNCWYIPYTYPHPLSLSSVTLSFTTQPVSVHTGNTMTAFVVTASDSTFSADITVAIGNCNASISGTLTINPTSGVATFSAVTATGNGVSCTLTASATGATSATSANFDVGPNQLGFTVQPSSSQTSGSSITFTVAGQYSNGTTDTAANNSVTISASAVAGSSCAVSGSTTQSLSSGVRAFSLTIAGAGSCSLTATGTGVSSATSNSFTVTGDSLVFTSQPPSSVNIGVPFTVAVTAQLPGGSTDTSITNVVTLTGNGCIISAPLVNPSSGVASFNAVVTAAGSGSCSITASGNSLTSGTSNTFSISGASPATPTTGISPRRAVRGVR